MDEPDMPSPQNWPTPYSEARATQMRDVLKDILAAYLAFAA